MGFLDRFLHKKPTSQNHPNFTLTVETANGKRYTLPVNAQKSAASAAADSPQPFGFKNGWLAIRCDSPDEAIESLGLSDPVPANWRTGLPQAGMDGRVFVSPCLDGFVLVIGLLDMAYRRPALDTWAQKVPELQYFATHRVCEAHCWAKYLDHRLVRAYFFTGESGEVTWDEGDMTAEEKELGFQRFPRGDTEEWGDDIRLPDEMDVLAIAAQWGIDPLFEQKTYPPAMGYLCKTP